MNLMLNIPRYIDTQEIEDIQDIKAHLKGGIPNTDIKALAQYWKVYPSLKQALFKKSNYKGYSQLIIDNYQLIIKQHPEFVAFGKKMDKHFAVWKTKSAEYLKSLGTNNKPKEVIHWLGENLLQQYADNVLIDKYNIYQYLMTYWNETMQDDCYIISLDGWKPKTYRIILENKAKKKIDKGWSCDLVPKVLVINRYFKIEKKAIKELKVENEVIISKIKELEEKHNQEDGCFAEIKKINKINIQKYLKKIKKQTNIENKIKILKSYLDLLTKQTIINKEIKHAEQDLDNKLYNKYPTFTKNDVKTLVVDDKWMQSIEKSIKSEIKQISQHLSNRIKELVERYKIPISEIDQQVKDMEHKVNTHLKKMGFSF